MTMLGYPAPGHLPSCLRSQGRMRQGWRHQHLCSCCSQGLWVPGTWWPFILPHFDLWWGWLTKTMRGANMMLHSPLAPWAHPGEVWSHTIPTSAIKKEAYVYRSVLMSGIFKAVTLHILQYTWKIGQKRQTKRWAALTWNWHAHFKPSPSSLHTPPYLHDDSSHTLTSDSLTFNSVKKNRKRRQKRNCKMSNFGDCLVLKPTESPRCHMAIEKSKEKSQSCSLGCPVWALSCSPGAALPGWHSSCR